MITHEKNPRFPHHCTISRIVDDGDPMTDETESVVIYDGECRSFDVQTTTEKGEVLTSTRKLSLPVKQGEWGGASRPIPQEGDSVVVDKGSYTEYGVVIDKMPSNLGTHILWRYGRN